MNHVSYMYMYTYVRILYIVCTHAVYMYMYMYSTVATHTLYDVHVATICKPTVNHDISFEPAQLLDCDYMQMYTYMYICMCTSYSCECM